MRVLDRASVQTHLLSFTTEAPQAMVRNLAFANPLSTTHEQIASWQEQVAILQPVLRNLVGRIYFEFDIPRMGRRIDVVVIGGAVVFVIEFKVGARTFDRAAINQVWDYALDLKNFH